MNPNDERDLDYLFRTEPDWRPDVNRGFARLRDLKEARRTRKRGWVLTGGVAAAVSLPLVAFPATRALAARCVSACVTETSAVRGFLLGGESLIPPSRTYIRPADRRAAPDFTLIDASGDPVTLSGLRGKVVLLNFWATWCPPCGLEIPWFMDFQRSKGTRGLEVVGVSMDAGGWDSVRPYIESRQVNYRVVVGNQTVARQFGGLNSLPLTLIIDRSGRIAAIHAGLCRRDEYQTDIDAVLDEK